MCSRVPGGHPPVYMGQSLPSRIIFSANTCFVNSSQLNRRLLHAEEGTSLAGRTVALQTAVNRSLLLEKSYGVNSRAVTKVSQLYFSMPQSAQLPNSSDGRMDTASLYEMPVNRGAASSLCFVQGFFASFK